MENNFIYPRKCINNPRNNVKLLTGLIKQFFFYCFRKKAITLILNTNFVAHTETLKLPKLLYFLGIHWYKTVQWIWSWIDVDQIINDEMIDNQREDYHLMIDRFIMRMQKEEENENRMLVMFAYSNYNIFTLLS